MMNRAGTTIRCIPVESPIGVVLLGATEAGICLLYFADSDLKSGKSAEAVLESLFSGAAFYPALEDPLLRAAREALAGYFDDSVPIPALPLDLSGGTPFQQAVWRALCAIPFGETRSYGQIASAIDRPGAFRAVGQACGRNPVPVIIPCHRVVGHGGRLGGYTGGLHIKRHLLDLETTPP